VERRAQRAGARAGAEADHPLTLDALIYDWNRDGRAVKADYRAVELDDETLRDGLQGPSVRNPPTEIKKRLLQLMDQLGIDSADIGLPGASERARAEIVALAKETTKLKTLKPNMALRTHPLDVAAAIKAAQESGVAIEACAFIGSSPIRRFAEDWSLDTMLRSVEESVTALAKAGLPIMFVTEDTTRADAETLVKLYDVAIGCGAKRICASDTVGHATPEGVRNLLTFLKKDVIRGRDVKLDYHGHNDRGLGTINALTATAIADRVHGSALGIGERVGNTSMDQLLINMQLWGLIDRDLASLIEYVGLVSEHCGAAIPANYPALGADAFRTGTGVHAAAVIKAIRKGDRALADRVYSGVPASVLGREQRIEVGPMSGESNVVFWLESHGHEVTKERIARILERAKASDRLLTADELEKLAR
jgi:2-isopropylmalate synthase